MSFFDNWKEFLIRAERQKLSTASQAAFYWIVAKFNAAHWADEIELSDNELMRLTRIRSTKTIADAKSRLKLAGLIDFKTSKYYGTTYKLVQLASTSWNDPQDTIQSTNQDTIQGKVQSEVAGAVSYTHAREDVKTKTEDFMTTTTTTRARASEGTDGVRESVETTPEIEVEQKPTAKVSHSVRHRWIQATWHNPTELDEEGLAALEKEFGSEKVFFAIGTANRYKKQPTINLRNVEVVLRGGDKPQAKGEMRNEPADDINAKYYGLR